MIKSDRAFVLLAFSLLRQAERSVDHALPISDQSWRELRSFYLPRTEPIERCIEHLRVIVSSSFLESEFEAPSVSNIDLNLGGFLHPLSGWLNRWMRPYVFGEADIAFIKSVMSDLLDFLSGQVPTDDSVIKMRYRLYLAQRVIEKAYRHRCDLCFADHVEN